MSFTVYGLQVGATPFMVVVRQADGRKVTKRTHAVQVYAPLVVRPSDVWLIVDSVFQVSTYVINCGMFKINVLVGPPHRASRI